MPKHTELYLRYIPLPASQHVYVNGAEQVENDDYTLQRGSHVVLPYVCEPNDRLECRYAHQGVAGAAAPVLVGPQPQCGGGPFPWTNQVVPVMGQQTSYLESINPVGVAIGLGGFTSRYFADADQGLSGSQYKYFQFNAYFRLPDGCVHTLEAGKGYLFSEYAYAPDYFTIAVPFSVPDYNWGLTAQSVYLGWSYFAYGVSNTGNTSGIFSAIQSVSERSYP